MKKKIVSILCLETIVFGLCGCTPATYVEIYSPQIDNREHHNLINFDDYTYESHKIYINEDESCDMVIHFTRDYSWEYEERK